MPIGRIDSFLLDTNVWLDYFLREGHSVAAAQSVKASYVVTNDKRMLAAMPEFCITPERTIELAA